MTKAAPKPDTPQVAALRIDVERSRARLMGTAHELQERVSPRILARGAWQGARDRGADLAEDAVDAVRARPVASGGAIAALALFLARHPLMDLASKVANGVTGKNRKERRKPKPKNTEKVDD